MTKTLVRKFSWAKPTQKNKSLRKLLAGAKISEHILVGGKVDLIVEAQKKGRGTRGPLFDQKKIRPEAERTSPGRTTMKAPEATIGRDNPPKQWDEREKKNNREVKGKNHD